MDIHTIASLVGQVLLVVFGAGSLALAVTLGWSEFKAWKLRRQRLLKSMHTPGRVPAVELRTGPTLTTRDKISRNTASHMVDSQYRDVPSHRVNGQR